MKKDIQKENPNDYRGKGSVLLFNLCLCHCTRNQHVANGKGACKKCKHNKFIQCEKFRPRPFAILISFANVEIAELKDEGETDALSEINAKGSSRAKGSDSAKGYSKAAKV